MGSDHFLEQNPFRSFLDLWHSLGKKCPHGWLGQLALERCLVENSMVNLVLGPYRKFFLRQSLLSLKQLGSVAAGDCNHILLLSDDSLGFQPKDVRADGVIFFVVLGGLGRLFLGKVGGV